jgi:hypothetical protein
MVAQYPDQAEDPNFAPWMASQGVSIERPKAATENKSSVAQMLNDAGITDPAKRQQIIMQAIDKQTQWAPDKSQGTRIEFDENGRPIITQGGPGIINGAGTAKQPPAGMQKPTANALEKEIIDQDKLIQRTYQIVDSFDREFLTYEGKLRAIGLNIKDKANRPLTEEQQKYLEEYTTFTQDAVENINRYIKEITGAQMSEAEAERLRKGVADAGDGLLKGDGPTVFLTKVRNTLKKAYLSRARAMMLRSQGLEWSTFDQRTREKYEAVISYKDVETAIQQRGDELEAQGLAPEAIKQTISSEFGVTK